jgi:hypothetical protein
MGVICSRIRTFRGLVSNKDVRTRSLVAGRSVVRMISGSYFVVGLAEGFGEVFTAGLAFADDFIDVTAGFTEAFGAGVAAMAGAPSRNAEATSAARVFFMYSPPIFSGFGAARGGAAL